MYKQILAKWNRFAARCSRDRYLPPRLLPYLQETQTVLDVGTFDGRLARTLMDCNPGLSITGIDAHVPDRTMIPVIQAEGHDLPFANRTFDTVMLVDVLHHDLDPGRILQEAVRVARRHVLIKDHYWNTTWDRALLSVSDYIGNRGHGIPLPYNYLRLEQWKALFDEVPVRVVSSETFHYCSYDRCRQVIFLLDTDALG